MDKNPCLPFKVGQLAESRSFIPGFRAAWFRCKIKEIKLKNGQFLHTLEYFDFPDEKLRCTKLYQKNKYDRLSSSHERKSHLMLRPCFPPHYSESQMVNLHNISGVVAIVVDEWKVGDLVDWWYEGCYWSGRITRLLGSDKVQIELPEPPQGEGKSYEAFCKDLRPSLDWSPEHGWTVPISTDSKTWRYCARLIQPLDQERGDGFPLRENSTSAVQGVSGYSHKQDEFSTSYSSVDSFLPPTKLSYLPTVDALKQTAHGESSNEMCTAHTSRSLDSGSRSGMANVSCSDRISLPHDKGVADTLNASNVSTSKDCCESKTPKRMRLVEDESVAPLFCCDTIESSIMGLEELAIKIKWVKGILQIGSWADSKKPSWKFLENHAFAGR